MLTSDFDYNLPEELIAQSPPEHRGDSKMLVLDRKTGDCEIRRFTDIVDYLSEGDCMVVNNTKVMNARFYGIKEGTGAKIELLLTMPLNEKATVWKSLVKPGKRVKAGTKIILEEHRTLEAFRKKSEASSHIAHFTRTSSAAGGLTPNDLKTSEDNPSVTILKKNEDGSYNVEFNDDIEKIQEIYGHTPLPPYIKREDEESDKNRYQTVYAKTPGAVAAPTAGLHFTDDIIAKFAEKGIDQAEVTLHVGPGTFKPVSVDDFREHKMHSEVYTLTRENADLINNTHRNNRKVLAVGTTSVRVLETCADEKGELEPGRGATDIFLYPPMKPKVPDMLLTNFHLPKSTLLMLVSTFAKRAHVLQAYEIAKSSNFRFYSYGDCMLLK